MATDVPCSENLFPNVKDKTAGNPGPAGAGGLIRDHQGNWVIGLARKIPWPSSVCTELWALHDGLELVLHGHYSPIQIEVDSYTILNFVINAQDSYNCYKVVVKHSGSTNPISIP
ncbi:hypothetical protein LIER_29297 [Lithospermum erythrorhizon]|uniref:RNase H type-1 domain-containing protein n=1 Tax=Lithospermum erythrorhizon TaxID=34254 RepID=A0AAV3RIQ2_LITER